MDITEYAGVIKERFSALDPEEQAVFDSLPETFMGETLMKIVPELVDAISPETEEAPMDQTAEAIPTQMDTPPAEPVM
jgi:hypothetical protein